jgi:hypothetical protein
MAAKKKVAAKAKTKTKAKVRLNWGKAGAKKSAKLDPAKEAKKLIKRAERLDKLAVHWTKLATKCREKATKLAAKTLAKPKCRYSPKMQAALAEIAKLGQEVKSSYAMNVVESPEGTAEAMQVVADVLKGDFR